MKLSFDWKFVFTSILTLAGLAIPFYLGQVDLSSRALTVRLISSSTLQSPSSAQFRDLQITLNGIAIPSPYLSSFELENTGSKPILSTDFERPIQIVSENGQKFVSAQLVGTDPQGIPVNITVGETGISIPPFLFNPNDIVSFSIITSGTAPQFSVNSRIAGVKEVRYEDFATRKGNLKLLIISAIVAVISMLFYVALAFKTVHTGTVTLRRPAMVGITAICGLASGFMFSKAYGELPFFTAYSEEVKITLGVLAFIAGLFGGYISYITAKKTYTQMS